MPRRTRRSPPHPNEVRRIRDQLVGVIDRYVDDYAWLHASVSPGTRSGEMVGGHTTGVSRPTETAALHGGKVDRELDVMASNLLWVARDKLPGWRRDVRTTLDVEMDPGAV